MYVLILGNETLGPPTSYASATREAKFASRLFGVAIKIFDVQTGRTVQWTH